MRVFTADRASTRVRREEGGWLRVGWPSFITTAQMNPRDAALINDAVRFEQEGSQPNRPSRFSSRRERFTNRIFLENIPSFRSIRFRFSIALSRYFKISTGNNQIREAKDDILARAVTKGCLRSRAAIVLPRIGIGFGREKKKKRKNLKEKFLR